MRLTLVTAGPPAQEIVVHELPAMIGRDDSAEIRVDDDSWIGHFQCIIDREGDMLRVMDLGTRTGTFLNGARVKRAVLLPGDILTVGKTDFTIQYECGVAGRVGEREHAGAGMG